MKRLFILLAACAAALVLPAAAAATSLAPLHAPVHARAADLGAHPMGLADRAPLRYVPLARTLSGTGTISLNVYDFYGSPEANAEAAWWVSEGDDWGTGYAYTDASGHVDLTGVPAATSDNGEVAVFLDSPDNGAYDLWDQSWGDSGWAGGLQPGRLPLTITRSGDSYYNGWNQARVRLYSPKTNETHMAVTDIPRTGSVTAGYAHTITTGPQTLSVGTIYFWDDEGMELPVSGIAVSSGTTASPTLDVREAQAHALWSILWGSGKPGTTTKVVFERFPAGWVNELGGVAAWPETAAFKSFGTKTSSGAKYEAKSITIPAGTAPGYKYWIWADHSTGPLSLMTSFQTCTLNASNTTLRRGARIRLSGVVPVKGHEGSTRGITKNVIIYKTTKSTGQPTSWVPKATIWTKVATVRANGLGKFISGYLKPTRTTRYVVRYPGDSWYRGAYTSVRKVTVR